MKTRCTLAALAILGLLLTGSTTRATEKLALKVTPNVSNAPSTVVVRAIVEPNKDNRWLHVEADSGEFLRSSDVQLDGDNAPSVTEFRLKNLPSGQYQVVAVLRDSLGKETLVRRTAVVLPRFSEP